MLEEDGWYFTGARGDHHYLEHDTKKEKITVPHHEKDIHLKSARRRRSPSTCTCRCATAPSR